MGLGAAILGSAVIGAGASLGGAALQASAAGDAAQVQENMFNKTQENLKPYMTAGTNSLGELMNLLGLGSKGQAGINDALTKTPGYQFQFGQGEEALLNARSATGGVRGGNTLKALTSFGQGEAQGVYQQQIANYGGVASLGENAAAGLGNTSASVGANVANSITGAGNSLSAGLVGAGNAASGAASNFLLASLLNGGGTGASAGVGAQLPGDLVGLT